MEYLRQMRLRNKLLVGFCVPAILTIAMSYLFYDSVNRLLKAFDWVDHTHTAIGYGDTLLGSMIDMETGLRGFLVAGDDVFLEPYIGGNTTFYDVLSKARTHVSDNAGQLSRLDQIESLKAAWIAEHAEPSISLRRDVVITDSSNGSASNSNTMSDVATFIGKGLGKKSMDKLREIVAAFVDEERELITQRAIEVNSIAATTKNTIIFGTIFSALASIGIVLLITKNVNRQLGTEPGTVEQIAKNIADGDLSKDLRTDKPASGVFAAMQIMQKNLKERLEQDRLASAEMARLKQALDSASASVIVTDKDLTVVYQNREAEKLFTRVEAELQSVSSSFSAKNLIGSSIDQLRTTDGVSRADLEQQTNSLEQNTKFGSVTLGQIFSPILDENGKHIGTVIEWQDRTNQLAVEDELKAVVDAALEGDLSKRLKLEGKDGFFLLLGERMNDLVSVCENVVGDTVRVFNAMSRYDLTETISENYKGSFALVKKNANLTMVQLASIIGDVRSDAVMLDSETSKLNNLNEQMFNTAETSSDQASNVSSAAEQISNNISGVASASTQMNASISEISRNAADATQIAGDAVSLAESTKITVRKLSDSSNDIGNVIKVINSIAEQTNLLALNATIEAARAGDAGKGFAVVANEVKELAKETAKATDEIGQKVATIQTDSESAVDAISGIDQTIQKINDIQVMIASAVTEQKSTTNEISRAVNEAAAGSNHIAENSSLAATGAMQALSSTSEAQQSTRELSQLASELSARVEQFNIKAS